MLNSSTVLYVQGYVRTDDGHDLRGSCINHMPVCLTAPTHDINTPTDVQYNCHNQTATDATLAGQGAVY